jgi:UDP-N-acetylmuramoyl-tripeptide--D-alanyl-D-alanine ligase
MKRGPGRWPGEMVEKTLMDSFLTTDDIVEATGGEIVRRGAGFFSGVSTDSRKISEGDLFIAIKGERFDGHEFVPQALLHANGALIDSRISHDWGKTLIGVKDTLKALQDLARYVRLRKGIRVIGITGSNGKTTTKELTASILSGKFSVLKSEGNLNNHIGLPLSLLNIRDHTVAVLEMGASGPGEIAFLCSIAKPDFGIVTNISPAHIAGFGDLETVRSTKLELLADAKAGVVNADDAFLSEGVGIAGSGNALVRYGIGHKADVRADRIRPSGSGHAFLLRYPDGRSVEADLPLPGLFNISNALAAAAAAFLMGIEPEAVKEAIGSFHGVPLRFEVKEADGIRIICDMYNANPGSMKEALREAAGLKKGRMIAVLGDMLELGAYEAQAHRELGKELSLYGADIFIAVGKGMSLAADEFKGETYRLDSAAEAGLTLRKIWREGDTVLIKGSRRMKMERVLEE